MAARWPQQLRSFQHSDQGRELQEMKKKKVNVVVSSHIACSFFRPSLSLSLSLLPSPLSLHPFSLPLLLFLYLLIKEGNLPRSLQWAFPASFAPVDHLAITENEDLDGYVHHSESSVAGGGREGEVSSCLSECIAVELE